MVFAIVLHRQGCETLFLTLEWYDQLTGIEDPMQTQTIPFRAALA
jgi:hypothetical protein